MKKMRTLSLLLAVVMLLGMLSACSGKQTEPAAPATPAPEATAASETAAQVEPTGERT